MELLTSKEVDQYVHDHSRAPAPLLDELRELTFASVPSPEMQVGRVEGGLLKMLAALMGARRILELGTYTGYSTLCMAEALPDGGEIITCDIDPQVTRIAQQFFDRSPHGKKIRIRLGDALETVLALPLGAPFDMAFLDADKERYPDYYEAIVPRLRPGGLLAADNTLWSGSVIAPQTESARAIARFNDLVTRDDRVENVLLSVRDGLMLARKR